MRAMGPAALSTTELLALVVRHGTRGQSALELSAELLRRFDGNLSRLAEADAIRLSELPGIGQTKALELQAIFELARRLASEEALRRPRLDKPSLIVQYKSGRIRHAGQEEFHVLLLDNKLQLVRETAVTIGLLDRCPIHPREVFRVAVQENCAAVIVCHNHPSGDPTPSPEDREATRRLAEAADILGIRLLDHIVLGSGSGGDPRYYSFNEHGELSDDRRTPSFT